MQLQAQIPPETWWLTVRSWCFNQEKIMYTGVNCSINCKRLQIRSWAFFFSESEGYWKAPWNTHFPEVSWNFHHVASIPVHLNYTKYWDRESLRRVLLKINIHSSTFGTWTNAVHNQPLQCLSSRARMHYYFFPCVFKNTCTSTRCCRETYKKQMSTSVGTFHLTDCLMTY